MAVIFARPIENISGDGDRKTRKHLVMMNTPLPHHMLALYGHHVHFEATPIYGLGQLVL